MLYLRSFKRIILISLALFGLSAFSPAHSDTVDHFGVFGAPIPFFDSALGTLETINISWSSEALFHLSGSSPTFGDPPYPSQNIEVTGSSTLIGGPSPMPTQQVTVRTKFERPGTFGDIFSVSFPITFETSITLAGPMEVDPYIGEGQYAVSGVIAAAICPPSTFSLGIRICRFALTQPTGSVDVTYHFVPTSVVPVPAAIWLFGTALIGLIGFGKRRKAA